MKTLPDQNFAFSSQPPYSPEPDSYRYKPARWQPAPASSNLSLGNYPAKICQSTTGRAVVSMALTIGMGFWLTTTADAGNPDQQCDDCPHPSELETFKTRLPSHKVSTQTDIAPASRATAQFAPAPFDQSVPDFARSVNAKLQQISAANQLSGRNFGNVSAVTAGVSAPASPSSVYQPLLSPGSGRLEIPPPPPIPASTQGQTLNEQRPEPMAQKIAHPPRPEQSVHLSQPERPQPLATVTMPVRSEPQPAFSASGPLPPSFAVNQPKTEVLLASVFSQSSPSGANTQALTLHEFLKLSSLSSADNKDHSTQAQLQHPVTRLPLDQYHQYWQSVTHLTSQSTQAIPTFGFVDFQQKLVVLPESAPTGAERYQEGAISE
jgi:hypothetical protein